MGRHAALYNGDETYDKKTMTQAPLFELSPAVPVPPAFAVYKLWPEAEEEEKE